MKKAGKSKYKSPKPAGDFRVVIRAGEDGTTVMTQAMADKFLTRFDTAVKLQQDDESQLVLKCKSTQGNDMIG